MKLSGDLPTPFLSAWDPNATVSGSIDPLGALRPFTAIATTLFPGVTTITSRVRYLSWVCAGLRLLDKLPNRPLGGRAGRARRQRILAWERLLALATGIHARANGVSEDDTSWRQLRGVSYVRRAIKDGVRSPAFPMLRNQGGTGGVGTYWVTLVAGGLVNHDTSALTPQGVSLADEFLRHRATPDQASLVGVLDGKNSMFDENVLCEWGRVAHLGAASAREKRLLANALLEPEAHRLMAAAIRATEAASSNGAAFQLLMAHFSAQQHRLAAILAIAKCFEYLHRELLYRFDQIRTTSSYGRRVPLNLMRIENGDVPLQRVGDALKDALERSDARLPRSVRMAVGDFSHAVQPAVRARNDAELVRELIHHHERVQGGKLDASRQPKLPWAELRGREVEIDGRYMLDELPAKPGRAEFTHPYRIEQFSGMLSETDDWGSAS